MPGIGTAPAGGFPFGAAASPPASANQAPLSSSRGIDTVTQKYRINDSDGGFEAMDDVTQRVYLLIAFADKRSPIITPEQNSARIARLQGALAILTDGRTPVIKNLSITIGDDGGGRLTPVVKYDRVIVNTQTTVPART